AALVALGRPHGLEPRRPAYRRPACPGALGPFLALVGLRGFVQELLGGRHRRFVPAKKPGGHASLARILLDLARPRWFALSASQPSRSRADPPASPAAHLG